MPTSGVKVRTPGRALVAAWRCDPQAPLAQHTRRTPRRRRPAATGTALGRWLLVALLPVVAAGCVHAPQPAVVEYFDEQTVTAITRLSAPLTFIAPRPDLSVQGGDMITLGPVQTILSAQQRLYLWTGFWSTLDRFRLQEPAPAPPPVLQIEADGQVLELALATAAPTAARRIYPAPSPGVRDAYYTITAAELTLLARARDLRLRVTDTAGNTAIYAPLDARADALGAFLDGEVAALPRQR